MILLGSVPSWCIGKTHVSGVDVRLRRAFADRLVAERD
jgi:hypothetical protein